MCLSFPICNKVPGATGDHHGFPPEACSMAPEPSSSPATVVPWVGLWTECLLVDGGLPGPLPGVYGAGNTCPVGKVL